MFTGETVTFASGTESKSIAGPQFLLSLHAVKLRGEEASGNKNVEINSVEDAEKCVFLCEAGREFEVCTGITDIS